MLEESNWEIRGELNKSTIYKVEDKVKALS